MKNKLFRLLAMCLLVAMALGISAPALATTKKPKLNSQTLWLIDNMSYGLDLYNLPAKARITSVSSGSPDVIKITSGRDMKPLKPGKSKITVLYKLNGKTYKLTATDTVKKCPTVMSSLKINGAPVTIPKARDEYWVDNYTQSTATISFKVAKGWKLVSFSRIDVGGLKDTRYPLRNGKAFKVPSDGDVPVELVFRNSKKETFTFTIVFSSFDE